MKNIGVVLSGCGAQDGSEVHEATLTLLFLDELGVNVTCFAPKIDQYHTIDHSTGKIQDREKRKVLIESARISKGEIVDLAEAKSEMLDGIIFPGGFGAAKNLCDFAYKQENCQINNDVKKIIESMHSAGKPQGFICIAPVLAARVLGSFNPQLTVGNNKETADILEKMGAKHIITNVEDIAYDQENKIVTTAAYMMGPTISKIAIGIRKLVQKIVEID